MGAVFDGNDMGFCGSRCISNALVDQLPALFKRYDLYCNGMDSIVRYSANFAGVGKGRYVLAVARGDFVLRGRGSLRFEMAGEE